MMSHDHYTTLNGILAKKVNKAKGVNFIRFMTVAPEKKCSVICHYAIEEEYAQPFQDEHYTIGEGALYYGLHPSFDAEKIIAAIKQGHFCNEEKLNAFLYEQRALFSLHRTYKPYLESVFAMTLLRMASRFGFVFQATEKALILFQQLKAECSELLVQGVTYKLDQDKRTVSFLGGFTDRLLQLLDRKGFSWIWDDEQKSLQLLLKHEAAVVHSFRDFNPSTHDVQLCYGSVYYSGVMPRVYRISVRESFSNQDVETMVLHAERTIYATLDAFDHGTVCAHPLLHSHYHLLMDFFRIEDDAQKVLFDGDPSQIKPLEMVELVNAYLRQSPNTHTVAVSGNIVDEGGGLLLAMRHAQSIDSGTYYCSVNG
ncbi:hypothetical protein [Domibacillus robiginosus]|uniref:hypothetical protein n=1 Tax=Domibacillus robiginosus TaxID=1071054 RepID=UPI00067CB18A|nr:hypothetical protein [Domibacillus robiginosus]